MRRKNNKKQGTDDPSAFSEGDLVGAKVKGYPLWPGFIEKVDMTKNNKPKYTVRFFWSQDSSSSFTQIKPFTNFTDAEKAVNKRGFQNALAECQEKHDSLSKQQQRETKKPPSPPQSDTNQEEEQSDERQSQNGVKIEPKDHVELKETTSNKLTAYDKNPEVTDQEIERAKSCSDKCSPSSGDISMDHSDQDDKKSESSEAKNDIATNDQLVSAKHDRTDDDEARKEFSLKSTEENARISVVGETSPNPANNSKQATLAKLKRKVAEKLKEKEKLKTRKRSQKFKNQITLVNRHLTTFSKLLDDLAANSKDRILLSRCLAYASKYKKRLPKLDICTRFISENFDMIPESEFYRYHETLGDLIGKMKKIKPKVPNDLKTELKSCIKATKKHESVKKFVNTTADDLFLSERKENDV